MARGLLAVRAGCSAAPDLLPPVDATTTRFVTGFALITGFAVQL